jgi:hypothetical protein
MAKSGKTVSPEVNKLLNHLQGIPKGKEKEALEIETSTRNRKDPGASLQMEGMWYGGCYYVRVRDGRAVKRARGKWRLVKCIA